MNNKKIETFFYSTFGVIAALIIVVTVNFILSPVRQGRWDLTEDKIYTLSEGTQAILKKVDTPITIRYYFTQDEDVDVPALFKTYARRVEDLLREYQELAPKYIKLEKLDPLPDTDAEDSANLDGIQGRMLRGGDQLYHGVSFTCLDQKETLPFLTPDRERLLEYDMSRAISRVMTDKKPIIGVISALPLMGSPATPQMMRMGQFQGSPPWLTINELKADFEVKEVAMTETEIPDDINVLLVVHPKNISEGLEYAIDQFVLGGGKLIAMVDPHCAMDQSAAPNPMMGGGQQQTSSSLDRLFQAWGVKFDKGKVVGDRTLRTMVGGGPNGAPQENPMVLSLTPDNVNTNDVATSQLGNMLMGWAGAFTNIAPTEGLEQTVLVETTVESQMLDAFLARMGPAAMNDFKSEDRKRSLAIRLSGKFKTAFPDGKPDETGPAEEEKNGEKKDDSGHLTESAEKNHVILVADADMIHETFYIRYQQFFGARIAQQVSANLNFIQNVVEQMAGDSNLINARSRAIKTRPLTVFTQMRADAEKGRQDKIQELVKDLEETNRRLNELQRTPEDASQKVFRSAQVEKEIEQFNEKKVEANKKLRELRKDLRKDVESLERKLKWANIVGMPAIVIVIGLMIGLIKRSKTAAR